MLLHAREHQGQMIAVGVSISGSWSKAPLTDSTGILATNNVSLATIPADWEISWLTTECKRMSLTDYIQLNGAEDVSLVARMLVAVSILTTTVLSCYLLDVVVIPPLMNDFLHCCGFSAVVRRTNHLVYQSTNS